ncbi:MAG: DNA repair protein RecO [Bdellovibrionales bacterium]|nr:DNA repair protein RecO [Bdellovibrionales bacterium]
MSNGIILRSTPYKENDLILTILSESLGKLSAYQRAAKRGKSSTCELFDCGRFELKPNARGLSRLSHFLPRNSFPGLRRSLESITAASFTCEVFDFIIPEQDEADASAMYQLLYQGLTDIAQAPDARQLLRVVFSSAKDLLTHAGLLDGNDSLAPSSKNLHSLIGIVENFSERRLKSSSTIFELIQQLKA